MFDGKKDLDSSPPPMPTPKVIIVYSAIVVYIKNQATKEYHYEDANQLSKDLARGKDRYRRWMDLGAATQRTQYGDAQAAITDRTFPPFEPKTSASTFRVPPPFRLQFPYRNIKHRLHILDKPGKPIRFFIP